MGKRGTKLEDLARLAGVSVATVSRALNDNPAINSETKRRIWKIARDQNYAFRPSMPALVTGAQATIAIVIPPPQGRHGRISDPFFQELIGGVIEAARDNNSDILVSHLAPNNYADLSSFMASSRANGVIFLGQSMLHERFNRLADDDKRFVVWGGQLPGQTYCSVGSDNLKGGERATAHLLRLGRSRIAFLGDLEAPESLQRHEGYRSAYTSAGLEAPPELTQKTRFEAESAEASIDRLLSQGIAFDGVFAANDIIAIGAIHALNRAGLNVPGDVSVVGYDNVAIAGFSRPSLTTISQDMEKAGRLLVSKLMQSEQSGYLESERLPTELIVRESCGA